MKIFLVIGIPFLLLFAVCGLFFILVPGTGTAIQIALGNIEEIQKKVDLLEEKAIAGETFSEGEKSFLTDLYDAIAFGGKLMGYAEASAMLSHYLHGNGTPLFVGAEAYTRNQKVKEAAVAVKERIKADINGGAFNKDRQYQSGKIVIDPAEDARLFYLSNIFYITARVNTDKTGRHVILFRVELEAKFISYDEMKKRFHDPKHFHTPFPTLQEGKVLALDDGLSHHLVTIGLAREYVYGTEWAEDL
jgi:hypothetical protein